MSEIMTRADRETLVKIARQRERVAKSAAKERAAFLIADFETQLDREFKFDDNEIWKDAVEVAGKVVKEAKSKIAAECARLGIPEQFAPSIDFHWYGQGRNAVRSERADMRRVAAKQVEAAEKAARTTIERQSLETQEKIMIGGLTTDDARRFLESMPTPETLMPALTVSSVRALIGGDR